MRVAILCVGSFMLLGAFSACASTAADSTDGHTSWFRRCATHGDCESGLSCECGSCTQACSNRTDCSGLQGASCVDPTEAGLCDDRPTLDGLCAVVCESAEDCPSGMQASCTRGVCVPQASGATQCKLGGEACDRFEDCCSLTCSMNECTDCQTEGEPCDAGCCSGLTCFEGQCSSCMETGPCERASECCTKVCSAGSCEPPPSCTDLQRFAEATFCERTLECTDGKSRLAHCVPAEGGLDCQCLVDGVETGAFYVEDPQSLGNVCAPLMNATGCELYGDLGFCYLDEALPIVVEECGFPLR